MTKINYIEIYAIAKNVMIRDMEDENLAQKIFSAIEPKLTEDYKNLDDRLMIIMSKLCTITHAELVDSIEIPMTLNEMFNLVDRLRVLAQEQKDQLDLQEQFDEMDKLDKMNILGNGE